MTPGARYLLRNSINLNIFRPIDSCYARCHHGVMTRKPDRPAGTGSRQENAERKPIIAPAIIYLPHSAPVRKAIAK
jgi:hypothetical protein